MPSRSPRNHRRQKPRVSRSRRAARAVGRGMKRAGRAGVRGTRSAASASARAARRASLSLAKKTVTTKTGRRLVAAGLIGTAAWYGADKQYPDKTAIIRESGREMAQAAGDIAEEGSWGAYRGGRRYLVKNHEWARTFFKMADSASEFIKEKNRQVEALMETFSPEDQKVFATTHFRPPDRRIGAGKARNRVPMYEKVLNGVAKEDRPVVYRWLAVELSRVYNIPPMLSVAVMHAESNFNPNARSWAKAAGLMQIVPRTGGSEIRRMKLRKVIIEPYSPNYYDPLYNIDGGIAYLDYLRDQMQRNSKGRSPDDYLKWGVMAYNAGYRGVTTGKTRQSGVMYWRRVHDKYRHWEKVDPDSFERQLRRKYPQYF